MTVQFDGNVQYKLNKYNRNLPIQGSRYERRRSRSKVDSFYNCSILKDRAFWECVNIQ